MTVFLGLLDRQIKSGESCDWSMSKIGGLPDFMSNVGESLYPCCGICESRLYLVAQIYCPLKDSSYHRTLYVFACSKKQCYNNPKSIVVWRCERLEVVVTTAPVQQPQISTDDWGMNDWCDSTNEVTAVESTKKSTESSQTSVQLLTDQLQANLSIKNYEKHIPHFVGYYIYVTDESETLCNVSTDYEMNLYEKYVEKEGDIQNAKSSVVNSTKNDEKYEKAKVKHGDQMFHQFKKRISNCPAQCLRYNLNGKALYLSSVSKVLPENVPNCEHCGSERVFELQLMPNLVTCLHEDNQDNNSSRDENANATNRDKKDSETVLFHVQDDLKTGVDFGCIYIYTCSKSCWNDGTDTMHVELAAVQADPDDEVIR